MEVGLENHTYDGFDFGTAVLANQVLDPLGVVVVINVCDDFLQRGSHTSTPEPYHQDGVSDE